MMKDELGFGSEKIARGEQKEWKSLFCTRTNKLVQETIFDKNRF